MSEEKFILEPIEQSTVTELVAKRLLSLLSEGILTPGDKLPPERELARRLSVGRTTVREALKLLTLCGLLEARRGDGTYVREEFTGFLSNQVEWPILLHVQDFDMVFEVREGLEPVAARLAAERATSEELERIGVFWQLVEIENRDIERETELDLEFHHAIAVASHNELLSRLMYSLTHVLQQYIALSNQMTDRLETTIAEHQAIYDAIAARDPDASAKAMVAHLAISKSWIQKAVAIEKSEIS